MPLGSFYLIFKIYIYILLKYLPSLRPEIEINIFNLWWVCPKFTTWLFNASIDVNNTFKFVLKIFNDHINVTLSLLPTMLN